MFKKLIMTFGGTGLLPGMPGSYASLVAAAIFYALWLVLGAWARLVIGGLTLVMIALSLVAWEWAHEYFKSRDARQFVLDEVIGQWMTLLCIPLSGNVLSLVAVGFFMFRGFDVAKPWPIGAVERLPGKWGTLMDDVAAAVYAVLGFWALIWATSGMMGAEAIAPVS